MQLTPKEPKENSTYRLTISVAGADAAEAEFSWDCDNPKLAGALEVRSSSPQDHLLPPGATDKIALIDDSGEVDLGLDLRKAVAIGPLNGVLKVTARALGQEGEGSLKLHVPGPDVVRLLAFDAAGNEIDPGAAVPCTHRGGSRAGRPSSCGLFPIARLLFC